MLSFNVVLKVKKKNICGWHLDPGSCDPALVAMPRLTLWVCCPAAEQLLLNAVFVYSLVARVLSGVGISMIRVSAVNQCHEWCTNQTRSLS